MKFDESQSYFVEKWNMKEGKWEKILVRNRPFFTKWPAAAKNHATKLARITGNTYRVTSSQGAVILTT